MALLEGVDLHHYYTSIALDMSIVRPLRFWLQDCYPVLSLCVAEIIDFGWCAVNFTVWLSQCGHCSALTAATALDARSDQVIIMCILLKAVFVSADKRP